MCGGSVLLVNGLGRKDRKYRGVAKKSTIWERKGGSLQDVRTRGRVPGVYSWKRGRLSRSGSEQ